MALISCGLLVLLLESRVVSQLTKILRDPLLTISVIKVIQRAMNHGLILGYGRLAYLEILMTSISLIIDIQGVLVSSLTSPSSRRISHRVILSPLERPCIPVLIALIISFESEAGLLLFEFSGNRFL
jgi:hypothetical protein